MDKNSRRAKHELIQVGTAVPRARLYGARPAIPDCVPLRERQQPADVPTWTIRCLALKGGFGGFTVKNGDFLGVFHGKSVV